jgi:hypothetical protein
MRRPPQIPHRLGRVKRTARRLFLLSDAISTGMLADAAYPRKRLCAPDDYRYMRRVLRQVAEPVGRGGGGGGFGGFGGSMEAPIPAYSRPGGGVRPGHLHLRGVLRRLGKRFFVMCITSRAQLGN